MFSAIRTGVMTKKGGAGGCATPTEAPTVVSKQLTKSSNAATSHTPTLPDSIQACDLLVCFASVMSTSVPATTSTGWTRVAYQTGNSAITTAIFTKQATGSDTIVLTISESKHLNAGIYCIRNANTIASAANAGVGPSDGHYEPPSCSIGSSKNFAALAHLAVPEYTSYYGLPSGYSNYLDSGSNANGPTIGAVQKTGLSGASEDPGYFSAQGSRSYVAYTALAYWS